MNELMVFNELHKFLLNELGPMKVTIAEKSLVLGYKPVSFWGMMPKFATLAPGKPYMCLILHVDPKNPQSNKGELIQQEAENIIGFNGI